MFYNFYLKNWVKIQRYMSVVALRLVSCVATDDT